MYEPKIYDHHLDYHIHLILNNGPMSFFKYEMNPKHYPSIQKLFPIFQTFLQIQYTKIY